MNVTGRKNSQELLHQTHPLFGVRVPSLGFLRQYGPDDGNGDFSHNDADSQKVDRLTTELPVGTIHRKDVSLFWLRDSLEDEAANRWETKREVEEKILEASVTAFIGTIFPIIRRGEDGEIDRTVLYDGGHQKRKALESSEVALQALCEGLKKFEIKHPNFGGPSSSQPFSPKSVKDQRVSSTIFLV